jgi:hypothetical protein
MRPHCRASGSLALLHKPLPGRGSCAPVAAATTTSCGGARHPFSSSRARVACRDDSGARWWVCQFRVTQAEARAGIPHRAPRKHTADRSLAAAFTCCALLLAGLRGDVAVVRAVGRAQPWQRR